MNLLSDQGDTYVVNGRKWWSTGALDERCKVPRHLFISIFIWVYIYTYFQNRLWDTLIRSKRARRQIETSNSTPAKPLGFHSDEYS